MTQIPPQADKTHSIQDSVWRVCVYVRKDQGQVVRNKCPPIKDTAKDLCVPWNIFSNYVDRR